ncbi:hypothetical protein Tco_0320264 [Tanacetum coccineum]
MRYGGICFHCKYDTNPNSLNFFDYPPQPQYETNICELCGNDAHYGYDCPPQVPFVYNQNPCFDQNFDINFPLTSPNFSQQNLVCENCGGPHATFQCQPMNQNFNYSNSFGFDQIQPPQQFDNHQPQEIPEIIPFIESKEWIETKNELYKMMKAYMERMNQQREQEALLAAQREQELREQEQAAQREQELFAQKQAAQEKEEPPQNSVFRQLIEEMCGTKASAEQKQKLEDTMLELDCRQKELYCMHNDVEDLIESPFNSKLLLINLKSQRLNKENQEVKNIAEPAAKRRTRITSWDKHLDTIPETESDEVIKSSVKNLVPIPNESEITSNNESECDVPVNDESSLIFTTFSNPLFDSNDDFTISDDESFLIRTFRMKNFKYLFEHLFDEEIISTKIDPHYFNAESNLIEYLVNRDTLIDSSPKFDYLLEEFFGELTHIDLIPPGINSSPKERNYENVDTIIEFPSPSPIPVEDSNSHMEEIDLFLATDDSMPPGIKSDDYDSKGDIRFLEELFSNDSSPLPKNESSNLDHFNDPSSSRPPPEPPDVEICFDFEPDTGVVTTKVVKGISEHYVLMPNIFKG